MIYQEWWKKVCYDQTWWLLMNSNALFEVFPYVITTLNSWISFLDMFMILCAPLEANIDVFWQLHSWLFCTMDLLDHLLKVNNIFTNFFFGKKSKWMALKWMFMWRNTNLKKDPLYGNAPTLLPMIYLWLKGSPQLSCKINE